VRVSTYADNDNTVEAFAFLRYAHASMEELTLLPRIGPDYDFVRRPIQPLSVANELSVLRHLAALAREQLAAYPTSLEQDAAELASGRWGYGSNRRNALVLLHGEKAVCAYYVRLSDTAQRIAAAPAEGLEALIAAEYASVSDEDKYVRSTLLPLLRRHRRSLQASAAASSQVAVSGAAAAVVPSSAPRPALPVAVADGSSPEQFAAAATAASAARPPASAAAPACGGSGCATEAASPATSESSADLPLGGGVTPDASSPGPLSPSSTIEVVGWRPDLLPAFEALNREWIETHFAVEETDLAVFRDPHATIVAPGGQIFFLLENGAVRGTCAVLRESATRYELGKMAVSPSAQGRGYGDRLLRAAIAFAREAGGEELVLSSNTKLGPALRLYEKHGFTALPHITDTRYSRVNIEMRLPLR
jgi:ribosomal protein S18 acetylase RimI-like enzyme